MPTTAKLHVHILLKNPTAQINLMLRICRLCLVAWKQATIACRLVALTLLLKAPLWYNLIGADLTMSLDIASWL